MVDHNVLIPLCEVAWKCTNCGVECETRPYGEDGAQVCISCALLNPEEFHARINAHVFGSKQ